MGDRPFKITGEDGSFDTNSEAVVMTGLPNFNCIGISGHVVCGEPMRQGDALVPEEMSGATFPQASRGWIQALAQPAPAAATIQASDN